MRQSDIEIKLSEIAKMKDDGTKMLRQSLKAAGTPDEKIQKTIAAHEFTMALLAKRVADLALEPQPQDEGSPLDTAALKETPTGQTDLPEDATTR
jgi:flagellar biosynthesis regulator FlaF